MEIKGNEGKKNVGGEKKKRGLTLHETLIPWILYLTYNHIRLTVVVSPPGDTHVILQLQKGFFFYCIYEVDC